MSTHYDNVLVFGPTGGVGNAVALEAGKRSTKVWLGMRDPSKSIPGLSAADDSDDSKFERIKADLSNAESVKAALQKSGAKAVFVYLIHGPGGLKGAVEAMKDAGVTNVVLLSSFTIKNGLDVRDVTQDWFISYIHAQAELLLEDAGLPHVALRPASFASNQFKQNLNTKTTPKELYTWEDGSIRMMDNIVPLDIGRVGGAVLVDKPSSKNKEIIYLFGPKIISEMQSAEIIRDNAKADIKIVQQTPDEWTERMKGTGIPPPVLENLVKAQTMTDHGLYDGDLPREGTENIKKYSGYEPTEFEDYAQGYKLA